MSLRTLHERRAAATDPRCMTVRTQLIPGPKTSSPPRKPVSSDSTFAQERRIAMRHTRILTSPYRRATATLPCLNLWANGRKPPSSEKRTVCTVYVRGRPSRLKTLSATTNCLIPPCPPYWCTRQPNGCPSRPRVTCRNNYVRHSNGPTAHSKLPAQSESSLGSRTVPHYMPRVPAARSAGDARRHTPCRRIPTVGSRFLGRRALAALPGQQSRSSGAP